MKKILKRAGTRSLPLAVLTLLITAFAMSASAQVVVPIKKGANVPATCSPSDIQTLLFYKTGSLNGLYYCDSTNHYSPTGYLGALTSASGAATISGSPPVITIVSAPKFTTARTINGVSFDGTANITVTAAANTLTGNLAISSFNGGSGASSSTYWRGDGTWVTLAGGGNALTTNPLSQFAATTSAQLAGVLSDESGSGAALFGTTPTIATPVINGLPTGTGVASAPTGSTLAARDSNANLSANSFLNGYTTTATAAGTTTLTVASTQLQYFTGTTTQTVVLPVASTMTLGQPFVFVNNSSGVVTIQSSGGNTVYPMAAGTSLVVTDVLTSGTGAASWSPVSYIPTFATSNSPNTAIIRDASGNFAAGTISANLSGTASNVTTNANLTGDVTSSGNATTVGKINGTSLAGLATGILKNTTTTGVPSVVAAPSGTIVGTSDSQALTNKDLTGAGNTFPTFNQNTTGSAATLTSARTINGTSFDGSANITVTAAAGTLTGSTLNSGVTASSLTSFGSSPAMTTPQITTGLGIGVAASTGNSIKGTEATAPSGAASNDLLYPDSTAHRWKMNNNNGGADTVTGAATTDTFTNKTFDTAGSGNSFSINGVAATANTGTGAVVRADSPAFTTQASSPVFTNSAGLTVSTGSNGNITLSPNGTGVISASHAIVNPSVSLTDNGSTIATDASLGNNFRVSALTANVTLSNPTNSSDGERVIWEVIQNASAAKTLAFGANFGFGAEITNCTISTTLSSHNFVTAIYNSTAGKWYVVGCVTGY